MLRHCLALIAVLVATESSLLAGTDALRAPVSPNDVIRIEIGRDDAPPEFRGVDERTRRLFEENRELRRRVLQLERAVVQLQQQVYHIDRQVQDKPEPRPVSRQWACSLTTSFNGTFVASATTKLEATAKTLKACEKAGASFCRERDVKCEREND